MGFHTFDPGKADRLDDVSRFRFCSREELLQYLPREGTVLDLGSGTGFYTEEIAPFVDRVLAVDVQAVMHDLYRESGIADNAHPVTADAGGLPFREDAVDGAVSTMTFHETTTDTGLRDLVRVLSPRSSFVVVDWSAAGNGNAGPPRAERFDAEQARELLASAGFDVAFATERTETFAAVARAPTA